MRPRVNLIESFAHPPISIGNTNYNNKLQQIFNHLSVLTNNSFNLMEVGSILGEDAYEVQRILEYALGTQSERFVVLTEQRWLVRGPMTGKRRKPFVFLRSQ